MMTISGPHSLMDDMFGRIPDLGETYVFNGVKWIVQSISVEMRQGTPHQTCTVELRHWT